MKTEMERKDKIVSNKESEKKETIDTSTKWEYSKSIENSKHVNLKNEYDLFINGKWSKVSKYFKTINPSNEKVLAKAAYASKKDVDKAVRSAERAFNNDLVAQVVFDGQEYIWIPSWPEVGAIIDALFLTENMNRIKRGKPELSFYEHLKKMKLNYIGDIKPC